MPDQGIRGIDPPDGCTADEQTDCIVIGGLLREGWPWSVDEIGRKFDNQQRAVESVRRLTGSGLAHQIGDLIFPTHAARRGADIEIGTV